MICSVALTSGSAGAGTSRPRKDNLPGSLEYADGDVSVTADQKVSATIGNGLLQYLGFY